jgi:two-component system chemotaxis sensor kinase CheA
MEIDLKAILHAHLVESEERLGQMEEALIALEAHPQDEKLLEAIFRHVHTLKGNSASLGLSKATEFAHAFEELLQRFRNGTLPVTRDRITLLLRSVDALRQITPEAIAGIDELRPDYVTLLKRLVNRESPGAENEPAPVTSDLGRCAEPFGRRREAFQVWMDRPGTIRVDVQKLDRMINLAGEIVIAQGRLRQVLETQMHREGEPLEAQAQLERLSMDLQEQIMKARMVPIGPIFRQYVRMVRDVAQGSGKLARLATNGEDVEIDLSVVEHLRDPLTHMIRNALGHGIETPEVRQARGKDPCGLITLRASHDGASIIIQLTDDGAGLNRERLIERARSLGMLSKSEELPDQNLYGLIFEPGFSTAETITDLSGRGVGMDVVRRNIEALRGSVAVESRAGKGTIFTIRLPLTLAIIDGFGVGVGDETYVLPLHSVLECLELSAEERQRRIAFGVINLRGEPLPYLRLRDWFQLGGPLPARENVVVVELNHARAGLAVDVLYGPRQTVIKPLGKQFQGPPCIAGSAILGNGRVALILDISRLLLEVMRMNGQANTGSSDAECSGTRLDQCQSQLHAAEPKGTL